MENIMNMDELISSEDELRSIVGYPSDLVIRKVIPFLDQHCREFIAQSPFLVMSTADKSGLCDVSPRGDDSGFVLVLDDLHIIIPERPGNRRIDSMRNIISNPQIGLIFLIPGMEETLRINGQACVTKDPALLGQMQVSGKIPTLGIGVKVQECYIHCAKAFKRSQLWNPLSWPKEKSLPNAAQILADHANITGYTKKEIQELLDESYTKRLY
ncbi:MAG TPA: pyridoxamine 5'-phosphate oxidase family protein [Bacilli bacterium]